MKKALNGGSPTPQRFTGLVLVAESTGTIDGTNSVVVPNAIATGSFSVPAGSRIWQVRMSLKMIASTPSRARYILLADGEVPGAIIAATRYFDVANSVAAEITAAIDAPAGFVPTTNFYVGVEPASDAAAGVAYSRWDAGLAINIYVRIGGVWSGVEQNSRPWLEVYGTTP